VHPAKPVRSVVAAPARKPSGAAPKVPVPLTRTYLEPKAATAHDSSTLVAPPLKVPAPLEAKPRPLPAAKAAPRNEDLQPEQDDENDEHLEADEPGESGRSSIERAVAAARTPFKPLAMGLAVGCILMLALCTYLFMKPPENGPAGNSASAGSNESGAAPALALVSKPKAPTKPVVNLFRQAATASGGENASLLIDGNFLNYDGNGGYAWYDFNAQPAGGLLVTLAKPQKMSRVRFLLWDREPDRYYSYILEGSSDGKKFTTLIDNGRKEMQSWQEIDFTPMDLKAVRIRGTANTKNAGIHVVEIEAYDSPPKAAKLSPPKGGVNEMSCKPGIWAQYYEGANHYATVADAPFFSRAEKSLGFGSTPVPQPNQGLQNWVLQGPCAAVFSGFVKIDQEGLYTFFLESDDGSRLYVDGELVVDNDGPHGMTEIWGQLDLRPGLHRIWVEYYNAGGAMGLNVQIKPKGGDKRPLGPDLFYNPAEARP